MKVNLQIYAVDQIFALPVSSSIKCPSSSEYISSTLSGTSLWTSDYITSALSGLPSEF